MNTTYDFSVFSTPFFSTGALFFIAGFSIVLCVGYYRFLREPNDSVFATTCICAFFVAVCVSMCVSVLYGNAATKLPLYEYETFHNLDLPRKMALLEKEFKSRIAMESVPKTVSWNDVVDGKAYVARMSDEQLVKEIESVESTKAKMDNLLERYGR